MALACCCTRRCPGSDLTGLEAGSVVADLVYVPLVTPLLAAAKARGLVAVDGLGMLLHQAVPGFRSDRARGRFGGGRPRLRAAGDAAAGGRQGARPRCRRWPWHAVAPGGARVPI